MNEKGVPIAGADPLPRKCSLPVMAPWGDTYRLDLYAPAGDPPPAGWPALLLLDGWGAFETAAEAVGRMARRPDATGVAPMAVIAISGVDGGYDEARRRRDFTTQTGAEGGGAASFLDLLLTRIVPAALSATPIDPTRIGLFGHSLAGFFCLWTLATRPDAFISYTAVSPSIWWDPEALTPPSRTRLPLPAPPRPQALILVGEWEDDLPPWQAEHPSAGSVRARRAARGMVAAARQHAERLGSMLGNDRVRFSVLADEDHASIVSAAIPRALRLVTRAVADKGQD